MTSSACKAPAFLIDWRIEVISRVVSPNLFNADAKSLTVDAPCGSKSAKVSNLPISSINSAFSPSKIVVAPCEKGRGWLTPVVGLRNIVILLLLTATGEIRTFSVATIVPVLSLIMTRAATSGLTSIFPIAAKKFVNCPRN